MHRLWGSSLISIANSTTNQVDITSGLYLRETYTFYVIAYGNASLPGYPANTTIAFSK